ncbi:MAG: hypothetical protein JSS00_06855, partial [Proteobacteria bacterium]|nr:hypothetical protein [Pseudomonadota bacterium]
IDDEAIVTQQTVVEPARRAADAPMRRPLVTRPGGEPAHEPAPRPAARENYGEPRPSFANDDIPEQRRPAAGGGFSLFGWRKPSVPEDELSPFAEFGDSDETAPSSREERVRDPSLDEELEIPAFLRRQMNPR